MKRNLDFNEISDGKRYGSDDLARVSCNECEGCSECCKVTEDTIHLDPYDVCALTNGLGKDFAVLLNEGIIALTVIDGVITPYLNKDAAGSCVFLSQEGRCNIHSFRPGFCRLFPLGRIYNEDNTFDYFIQVHECPYPSKSKVKISKWIGINGLKDYEKFISKYHEVTKKIVKIAETGTEEELAKANTNLLRILFLNPYSPDSFFTDFYERVDQL